MTRGTSGISLIESLVALLILSVGMLLNARFQNHLSLHADLARQRAQAVQLAENEFETLRADPALPGLDREFASGSGASTVYRVQRRRATPTGLDASQVSIGVDWTDRSGAARHAQLDSIVAGPDPTHSGALGLARGGAAIGAVGRSSQVPIRAVDLGDGHSVFKPVETGRIAIVFDNLDGSVIARCDRIDPSLASGDLRADHLGACVSMGGRLLSGVVRFSSASPPDSAHASEAPLPFEVVLALGRGKYLNAPVCTSETWPQQGQDRYAIYHCVVSPRADGRWSGKLTLVPIGWSIGAHQDARRVCRYVIDLDLSGAIDANLEHPETYADVANNLPNQNYLVVAGPEACPNPFVGGLGNNGGLDPPPATQAHQP